MFSVVIHVLHTIHCYTMQITQYAPSHDMAGTKYRHQNILYLIHLLVSAQEVVKDPIAAQCYKNYTIRIQLHSTVTAPNTLVNNIVN